MKLHREIEITEGQGPVPVVLTLDEIIRDGKVTNHYQIFVLSWLSEFFSTGINKNGIVPGSLAVGNPVEFGNATSSDVINGLKSLSGEAQVMLAIYLKSCVEVGENLISTPMMSTYEWIKHVLRVQR
jgi:hypothetical protein